MAIDVVPIGVRFDIFGPGLDRRLQHLVGRRLGGIELDRAELVEIEGDRARLAEIATELGEDRAHLARRTVAVVGQGLDDHADAASTEALVAHRLIIGATRLLALLDRPLDIVLRHVHRARRLDRASQPRIHRRVWQAELCGGRDLASELGEQLGALLVLGAFAELDVLELGMARHGASTY